jgi:hypothetical protein
MIKINIITINHLKIHYIIVVIMDNLIGSIIMYNGDLEPDGWIFCDGVPRNNDNNKFKNLLDIGIGKIVNDKYIIDNYSKSIVCNFDTDSNEIVNSIIKLRSVDDIKNNIIHCYIVNNSFKEYNNKLTDKTSVEFNPMLQSKTINWLIKYK